MKRFKIYQLLLIVFAATIFAACEHENPTITAYGMEHEVIGKRDLTLIIQPTYEYTSPRWWGDSSTMIPCFVGIDEKSGERYFFCEGEIEGFTFKEGKYYYILVREYQIADPPADASDRVYKFIKFLNNYLLFY